MSAGDLHSAKIENLRYGGLPLAVDPGTEQRSRGGFDIAEEAVAGIKAERGYIIMRRVLGRTRIVGLSVRGVPSLHEVAA